MTAEPGAPTVDELLDALRRERADFLNFKRRADHERQEERERGRMDVLERLIPVLDELNRAVEQLPDDIKDHRWVQGIMLIRQRLLDALSDVGVQHVGARGEAFDPTLHEALFYDEDPAATERRLDSIVAGGYRRGDRLIRPARVVVKGPPVSAEQGDGNEDLPEAGGPSDS